MSNAYAVERRLDIAYAEHDGVRLVGDLYAPASLPNAPVVIAVHGGAWYLGDRKRYQYLGPYLARNGFAVFSVQYRLATSRVGTYPQAVCDVRAAVQFVRGQAAALGCAGDQIAIVGDSAGAHLGALVALAGEEPPVATHYPDGIARQVRPAISAVIGIYGVYDLLKQWEHDQLERAGDQITERFLGASPLDNRRIFFEASPISHATRDKARTRFLLIHGQEDDVVDVSQTRSFLTALKRAGFFARAIILPGAGHFWVEDPIDEPGSIGLSVGPPILRFLHASFAARK